MTFFCHRVYWFCDEYKTNDKNMLSIYTSTYRTLQMLYFVHYSDRTFGEGLSTDRLDRKSP